jgi:tRNA-splicing ligase RtcB
MDPARLTQVDPTTWRIGPFGAMRVPAIIYADEGLIRDIDDKVYEQAANVATLSRHREGLLRDAGCAL